MKVLNIKSITPLNNQVITTMVKYTEEELKQDGLIDINKIKNPIKEYQEVVAVGPMVRSIKVGDIVMINPKRYAKNQYKENSLKDNVVSYNSVISYQFNILELDHVQHLMLFDSDIDFIINDYEYEEQKEETPNSSNKIIIPKKKLIL